MKRPFILVACASAALAFTSLGSATANAPAESSQTLIHRASSSVVASTGSLKSGPAKQVNLGNMPSNGAQAQGSTWRTLLRNGNPTGTNLASQPTTGSKPGAGAQSSPAPNIIENGFDGTGFANSNCFCQPPDVNAAIGPNHIVESVNLSLAVYTKSGTLIQNTALSTFLGDPGNNLSDPRVVYDPTWNRWQLVVLDVANTALWLGYSAGPDPTGSWYIYHVGVGGFPAGTILDYPMVGMDQDAYIYTSNNFAPDGLGGYNYVNSTAFTVAKARVYNGYGFSANLPGVPYNTTPSITGGRPTQQSNRSYLLSPDDFNNVMNVYYFVNTASGSPTLTFKGAIPYNWAAPPRQINQPGTSQKLDPLDGRIGWAVSSLDGRLWFAHGIALGSFPAVGWGFVDPSSMTIQASDAYFSGTSDDFNPSIAAQKGPAGTQEVLSWAYTDTPNNVATRTAFAIHGAFTIVHIGGNNASGPGSSTSSEFRFGDYSSVSPEYNANGTCAEGTYALVANQYFAADGSWKTRLARVHNAC